MCDTLNKDEILRYIGASSSDDMLDAMISRAQKEVLAASRAKYVYKHIPLHVDRVSGAVDLAGYIVKSSDLAAHLAGCQEGYLFACTLGPGVDQLVKRYSITDVSMLPVIQAVAGAYTELCADRGQSEIEILTHGGGMYLRPRFSPGYGDFRLSCQQFFFDALEISKRIGVYLTESFLMVPFKSITAVIGISRDPSQCHINKCMACPANNCPFRREDRKDYPYE